MGEWFADYHGYVPIQMAAGLDRAMRERGLSFPEAYALLLERGVIIHIDPADDAVPAARPPILPPAGVESSHD